MRALPRPYKGRWRLQWVEGGRRYSVTANTPQEALEAVRAKQESEERPFATLAGYIAQYLEDLPDSTRREQAAHDRASRHLWLTPALLPTEIGDVQPADIFSARATLQKREGWSNSTTNRWTSALSSFWQWLVDTGRASFNPCRQLRRLKEPRGRTRVLSPAEEKRLLAACRASSCPHLAPLVVLALDTGARRSELLWLRWEDLVLSPSDMEGVEVPGQVRFVHDPGAGRWIKNDEEKILPLMAATVEALRELRRQAPLEPGLVFPSRGYAGRPLDFRSAWAAALRRAGLAGTGVVFHTLRHTAGSRLAAAAGGDLRAVAGHLGQRELRTTERYAHQPRREAILAAMNRR